MKETLLIAIGLLVISVSFHILEINRNDCAAKGGILLQSGGSYICVEGKEIK